MNKKIAKDTKKIVADKKVGKPIKDVVPLSNKPPREMLPIVNQQLTEKDYHTEFKPFEIFPEWPTDEFARV